MTEPKAKTLAAGKKSPPLPIWRVLNRASPLFDRYSTSEEKRAIADEAAAKNRALVSYFEKKHQEAQASGKDDDAKEIKSQLDFVTDTVEFIDRVSLAFDRHKRALNKAKDNLQFELEEKLKEPGYLKVVQRMLPWLGGAVATSAVVGSGIWKWFTGHMQDVFSAFDPENVKEIVNIAGLLLLGGATYLVDLSSVKRKTRLVHKCELRKRKIDTVEDDLRTNALKLVEIEYDRLALAYGFEPAKLREDDVWSIKAHEIVDGIQKKYGFILPMPNSLLNGNGYSPEKGRLARFASGISAAFRVLFPRKPSFDCAPAPSEDVLAQ